MQEYFAAVTDAKFTDEHHGLVDATVDGRFISGIHAKSRYWRSIQHHMDNGGEIAAYAPLPLTAEELFARADAELLKISARTLEDIIDERVVDGKFVSQAVRDKIAERRALREQR